MDGSSSRDGNGKNGKRAADQSFTNKVKEPRRGMGIAKLEKMRAEEEMKEKYFKNPFSQAHISGAGIQGMVSIPIFFFFLKNTCVIHHVHAWLCFYITISLIAFSAY
jgi:hypothetical protein